jgi:DNA/RNA-binding domain of Phe-tRNA-synthetase-like protein
MRSTNRPTGRNILEGFSGYDSHMIFIVAEECTRFGLRAGAVVFRNVHVNASSPFQRTEIANEATAVRARFSSLTAIRDNPLVSGFHSLLRKFGVNPKTDRPSLERLLTFALRRGDLPVINNLVDVYNLVSVRSSCSLGAHDLNRISLPVSLRLLDGTESFTPLGSDKPIPSTAGEFGYVDASNRLLCRLDILQAEFSKVTEATENVLLIVEGTAVHSPRIIDQAINQVIDLVSRYCGGTAEIISFPQ